MSAIFGAIDFSGKEVSRALGENFLANYQKYKIDRMEQISEGNLFMGCGIQYFNHEAEREQLPYYDAERNIFFTADCVIDNREELIETLGLENNVPDGRIILEAYYKWGKGCLQKLRGPFSFVVYERETGKVFMAVDHFAQRCLMYHLRDGVLYFSTLLFPMIDSLGLKFFENERWLLDSISVRGAIMVSEPKETSVQDVYKVVAGNYIEFYLKEDNKIYKNEVRYFNPERDVKTDYTITQEQSEKMIRSVMSKNISQIIRKDVEIASQLSSGLDSSTVACTAAGQLAARGRTLYTYTSVPDKDANLKNKGYFVTDEREGVEKICRDYPNIEPTFVDTKGRNILKEIDDILDCWEMPCKSQQNAIWVDEISKLASKRGCRILLCGATGNTTLSAGDNACAFAYYAKRLRFIKALKMLDPIKRNGFSRKRYAKSVFGEYKQYLQWYFDKDLRNIYKNTATNAELGERYDLTKRFHKAFFHNRPKSNINGMRREMYMELSYAQIGEIDTKLSLKTGIITRDPMRTVELIELCMKLPLECFVSSDFDRRLVRVGMEGIVPKVIREDMRHRGRQSGDNSYRVKKAWPEVSPEVKNRLYRDEAIKFFDKEKLSNLLKGMDENIDEISDLDLSLAVDLYSFGSYINLLNNTHGVA